jgi:hypothetical protein
VLLPLPGVVVAVPGVVVAVPGVVVAVPGNVVLPTPAEPPNWRMQRSRCSPIMPTQRLGSVPAPEMLLPLEPEGELGGGVVPMALEGGVVPSDGGVVVAPLGGAVVAPLGGGVVAPLGGVVAVCAKAAPANAAAARATSVFRFISFSSRYPPRFCSAKSQFRRFSMTAARKRSRWLR